MRLNLGPGDWKPEGWRTVDLEDADELVDLETFPWPWESDSITDILAGHILEHFDKSTGYEFIAECKRILKPTGVLYLAVPDMDLFVNAIVTGDRSKIQDYKWGSLDTLLGGGQAESRPHYRHRALYNYETLIYMLESAGLDNKYRRDFFDGLDNPKYRPISLYMLAVK